MKPFNLERALAGDPVVTRDGCKVLEIRVFEHPSVEWCVFALVEGHDICCYNREGLIYSPMVNVSSGGLDLLMAPKEKTLWINLYRSTRSSSGYDAQMPYTSEEAAFRGAHAARENFIKTITVTIEE